VVAQAKDNSGVKLSARGNRKDYVICELAKG